MTYLRLPYADAETMPTMTSDALAAEDNLHLPPQREGRPTDFFGSDHPSFDDSVAVPHRAADLASALELHLD